MSHTSWMRIFQGRSSTRKFSIDKNSLVGFIGLIGLIGYWSLIGGYRPATHSVSLRVYNRLRMVSEVEP